MIFVQRISNMRSFHLVIIVSVSSILISTSSYHALAIPYFSPQELYKLSDMVFYGQVLTKERGPGPDWYYYQVKVATYFKNPQTSDTVTVAGHKPGDPRAPYPQFEVGDNAIFYIRKTDGINTIYWNSQKAGNACDVHSFLGSAPSTEPRIGHVPSTHLYIEDTSGNMPYIPLTNHTAVIRDDDVWNNYPEVRTVSVGLSIQNEYEGKLVFNKTQNLEMQACSGPERIKWNFVPTQIENYVATVVDDKTKISMIFEAISNAYASNSQIILSPLKQFKSGIAEKDITCRQDFDLLIKIHDNSPACVKPQTAQKLVERGWGLLKEQMVWFEFDPFQCETTPWDEYWLKIHPHDIAPPPSRFIIYTFFKINVVNLLDARENYIPVGKPCGTLSDVTYYFLVLKSDSDKMTNLGYKILVTPLQQYTNQIR